MNRLTRLLLLAIAGCSSERPATPAAPQTLTATELQFTVQPSSGIACLPTTTALRVTARTRSGTTVVNFTGAVSMALGENAGGAAITGQSTVSAVAGVATFTNLRISQPGAGYTLIAKALDLTATSNAFDVAPCQSAQVAFVRDSQIYLMTVDGSGVTQLSTGPEAHSDPAWSPDGTKLAFTNLATGGISVMNADGSGVVRLISRGFNPSWSPDGRKIAFATVLNSTPSAVNYGSQIAVMNSDGSGFRWLTSSSPDGSADDSPAWSPDGTRLAFVRSEPDVAPTLIYLMPAAGFSGAPPLTFLREGIQCDESAPAWTPDGSKLLFWSFCAVGYPAGPGGAGFAIGNSDGSGSMTPIESGVAETYSSDPRWSPDGKWIIFSTGVVGPDPEIYVIRADGSGAVQLGPGVKPVWRPGRGITR